MATLLKLARLGKHETGALEIAFESQIITHRKEGQPVFRQQPSASSNEFCAGVSAYLEKPSILMGDWWLMLLLSIKRQSAESKIQHFDW